MKGKEFLFHLQQKFKEKNEESFLVLKAMYFLCFLSFGVFFPYLYVYLESHNMTDSQTGFIAALNPLACFFVVPIWTILADKYDRHKLLIIFTQILALILYLLLLVPFNTIPINPNSTTSNSNDFSTSKLFVNSQNDFDTHNILSKENIISTYTSNYQQFIYYIIIYFGSAIVNSPLVSLIDGVTMIHIKPKIERFGKIRMFNGIGWLTGSVISAILTIEFGLNVIFFNYTVAALLFILISTLFLSNSYHAKLQEKNNQNNNNNNENDIELEDIIPIDQSILFQKDVKENIKGENESKEIIGNVNNNYNNNNNNNKENNNYNEENNNSNNEIKENVISIGNEIKIEEENIQLETEEDQLLKSEEREEDSQMKLINDDVIELTASKKINENDSLIQQEGTEIIIKLEDEENELTIDIGSLPFSKKLKILFSNSRFIIFLITVASAGIAQGIFGYFNGIYIVEVLGAKDYIVGILTIFQTCTEIPMFYFSQSLIQRFGLKATISTSLVAYMIRLLLFSIAPSAIFILFVELLHGVSYGLFFVSATIYVGSLAPPGLETTAQGTLVSIFFGIARAMAGIFGGMFFDTFGPVILYYSTAALMFLSLIFFLISHRPVPPKITSVTEN